MLYSRGIKVSIDVMLVICINVNRIRLKETIFKASVEVAVIGGG
jgi:hypothetical protein